MAGVNKVILVGNLGQDPEVKHLEGDKVVASNSLIHASSSAVNSLPFKTSVTNARKSSGFFSGKP